MASINVFAQGDSSGTSLIKTADGVLWVENGENARFILEIKGADIRPMQQYPFLSVDGRPMQVHVAKPARLHYPMIQISNDQQMANLIKPDTGQKAFTA